MMEIMKISACDQKIKVTVPGFKFNTNGSLMSRPEIRCKDEHIEIPFPKGMKLRDWLRNNLYRGRVVDSNWDEINMLEIEDDGILPPTTKFE